MPFCENQAERQETMKLKIRYENEFQTIELDAKATDEMWVSLSLDCDDKLILRFSDDAEIKPEWFVNAEQLNY